MEKFEEYKSNVRILCIEDEPHAALKLIKILSKYYKNIDLANNGEEALEIYRDCYIENKPIDLIISDINMPKIDGIELIERIREFDENLPFIYVSARLDLETLLKLVKLDIVNFITKPIDVDELLKSVNKVILNKYKSLFFRSNHIQDNIEVGKNLQWNYKSKSLLLNEEIIKLTKNEIMLLELLISSINSVVTTENVIDTIWADSCSESNISNLKNLISRLRIKVPQLDIENIYGLGYKIRNQ